MIKTYTYLLLILLMPISIVGQDNKLESFDNLVGKTWVANGEWSNGSKFKQEISFNYDLNKTLIITNSKGYTNQEQTEYGNRNHGIRQYNSKNDKIEFWEFDVFGGVTQGTVEVIGNSIFYHYKYGESIVTDCWEYIDDSTYKFIVGSYKDGQWEAVYIQTEFKLKN